jgi:microcystin-dependent protein
MADPFVAEVRIFPFNFAPKGWAFCNGQLLPISQNTALFSLLGTYYGGDGKSNFSLPDIEGRAVMHPGQGPGLRLHDQGETDGSQTVTLLDSELPAHNHQMMGATQDPALAKAVNSNASWALSQGGGIYQSTKNTQLAAQAVTPTGGSGPHNNMQPFLTLHFNIALQGVFPPRG